MKDLIILGNGMAGMTAALYAKRANLNFDIIGKDSYDFGQIGNAILVQKAKVVLIWQCLSMTSSKPMALKLRSMR